MLTSELRRAKAPTAEPISPTITNPDPTIAIARGNGPWLIVCNNTPSGKTTAPARRPIARNILKRSAKFTRSNPMPMHIHLPLVHILRFTILLQRTLHGPGISLGGSRKASRQGTSNVVQGLVLGKDGIPQPVTHPPNR